MIKEVNTLQQDDLTAWLKGKHVLVVGLAKSGLAAVQLLTQKKAIVFVSDSQNKEKLSSFISKLPKSVSTEFGSNHFLKKDFDLIILSPGIPWDLPPLVAAREKKIPVWPELELAARLIKPKKIIAITGTNGKTTTTTMIGEILKRSGRKVLVGGNIGTPLSDLQRKIDGDTYVVLEVSSYQLEGHQSFHPHVGVLLNVTPDHLKRHKTMARYAAAKARLFDFFTKKDVAILNTHDKWCKKLSSKIKGRKVWFPSENLKKIANVIQIPGQHNKENAMAAAAVCLNLGVSIPVIKKALFQLKGVPHRIQFVKDLNGVKYFNDSKGTNVDSTEVALKAFENSIILILGGEHKGASYKQLVPEIKKKVRFVLTIGKAHREIVKDLSSSTKIISCKKMKTAVITAQKMALKGDVVLLSPACASFDQYKNYEERGDDFMQLVRGLK
ncbi:MAG: UDP-N-acetylmuramoyl-L-alanine--D-glutamate ligase [Elusimicrobiota bacterium]